jgi:hypothetical protein
LVAATVPLLIIAGTLEGFLSPSHAPIALKFSISALLLTALLLWLSEGWRRPLAQATQDRRLHPAKKQAPDAA